MKKKKNEDHLFIYDANKQEWVNKSPSIMKEPYNKPDLTLENQLKDYLEEIGNLGSQIALLKGIILDLFKK